MRILVCIIFVLGLVACSGDPGSSESSYAQLVEDSCVHALMADSVQKAETYKSANASNDSIYLHELLVKVRSYDTITPKGNFIRHYVDSIEQIYIYWGTATGQIIDTMLDEGGGFLWGSCSEYIGETDKYLVINSFGKGYKHVWLLPLNKSDTVTYFEGGVIDLDIDKNLVLSTPGGLMLTNIATGKYVQFMPKTLQSGMYGLYEIYNIEFRTNAVYFEWTDDRGKVCSHLQKL